jgi:hypothetical protein
MFTGSFHPIEDNSWEDRTSWDKTAKMPLPTTLPSLFTQRADIKMQFVKRIAQAAFIKMFPFFGKGIKTTITFCSHL